MNQSPGQANVPPLTGTGDGRIPSWTTTWNSKTTKAAAAAFVFWFPGWLNGSGLLDASMHLPKQAVAALNFVAGLCTIAAVLFSRDAAKLVGQAVDAKTDINAAHIATVASVTADVVDPRVTISTPDAAQTASVLRGVAESAAPKDTP